MIEIADIRGNRLFFEDSPGRIVSLVPSLTESVIELNCPDRIIGCTSYCLEIDGAKGIGAVGGPKNPDIDAIRSLRPDLVLASREENRLEDVEEIEKFCPVYVCEPRTVEDVDKLLDDLSIILGTPDGYEKWSKKIIEGRAELNSMKLEMRPIKFGYLVWWDPLIVAGGHTYISSLLSEGPFQNAFGDIPRYTAIPLEDFFEREMDAVFISSEPYDFSDGIMAEIDRRAGGIRVERIDGRMCGWYGTRTAQALEYLRHLSSRLKK